MNFNFNLSLEETNVIIGALSKEPYGVVYQIIDSLKLQANEQQRQEQQKIVDNQ